MVGKKRFVLKEKFKLMKDKLWRWNKEIFGSFYLNIDKVVSDLMSLITSFLKGEMWGI